MTRITDQLDRALEDLTRASNALPDVLHSMRDAMGGQPGAQSYDTASSRVPVLYCERHEGDRSDCPPEDMCTGIPVAVHTDMTGDAAVAAAEGRDVGRRDHRELQRLVADHERLARQIVDIIARWQRRPANAIERRTTEAENRRREPMCEVCLRSGKQVDAIVAATNPAGALSRPYVCCRWHHDFVTDHHRLPTQEEERMHQQGKRVVIRAVQTDRLRRGIHTGRLV